VNKTNTIATLTSILLFSSLLVNGNNKISNKQNDPIRENSDTINFVAIYDAGGFQNTFITFAEECKSMKDSLEKYNKKPVNLKIFEIKNKRIEENDSTQNKDTTEIIKETKRNIDTYMTLFAKKHGKIDLGIISFHSYPKESTICSYMYIDSKNKATCREINLNKDELKQIASENIYAKSLFSKNALFLYKGCSAGRGDSSIAETFSESYNVKTIAPEQVYAGKVVWNGKQVTLESKEFYIKEDTSRYCSIYKISNNHTYVLLKESGDLADLTINSIMFIEDLIKNKTINISEEQLEKSYRENDVAKKMEYWGFELIEDKIPIGSLMKLRVFYPK